MEKGKISALQMGIMMFFTILATAILLVPQITTQHAGRDMWMSPIWASSIGFLTVLIAYRLSKFYPSKTIIQYSTHILGVIPGKMLGMIFLFFYLHVNGIIIREYGEFVVGVFLPRTPIVVVMGCILLVCAFAVQGGIEVVGRLAQMIGPVAILLLLLIIVLLLPDVDLKNMLPVMEKGIMPSIKGAITPQGWFSEFFLIAFLLPYLTDRDKGMKWGMISVIAVMVTMLITNFAVLFVLGDISANLIYPVMSAVQYISIADFLEHLEAIVMAVWVTGAFIKISVFYYALTLGTAQWLNLSDYRPVVFPLGFLLLVFAIWSAPNLSEMAHFLGTTAPFYSISIQTVIPLFLLIIAFIRNKGAGPRGGQKG